MRTFALGAAAALVTAVVTASPLAAQRDRTRIDTTFAFGDGGEAVLSLPAGDIVVNGWARSEVRVVAVSRLGEITTSFSRNRVRLEARARGNSGVPARYELWVPVGTRVSASTLSGDIGVSGTRGPVSLTSASGDISASDVVGRVSVETMSGQVSLARVDGTTHISAISGGGVRINEIRGELDIDVVTAAARIEGGDVSALRFDGTAGRLDYSGTLGTQGRHEIDTHTGSVILRVPAGFAATIEFDSFSGAMSSPDFPVTLRPGSGNARGRDSQRQTYDINGGGARIAIQTFSGRVDVRQIGAPDRR